MGANYCNIIVRAEHRKVVGYLTYARHSAYVSPPSHDGSNCVVCPDEPDPRPLAEELSEKLGCVAVATLNDDDDQFLYWLWDHGTLVDKHESPRNAVGESPEPGIVAPDEWTPEWDRPGGRLDERWDGEESDEHRQPTPGDALAICRAFDRTESVAAVRRILDPASDEDRHDSATHLYHAELAQLLGWPTQVTDSYQSVRYGRMQRDDTDGSWTPTGQAD